MSSGGLGALFSRFTIAARLNAITVVAVFTLFALAIIFLSSYISAMLIEDSKKMITMIEKQSLVAIGTLEKSLDTQIKSNIALFGATLKGNFTLRQGERIEVSGASTPALLLNGSPLNNDNSYVDEYTLMSGLVATIFALDGDTFVRISSSLKKEDGERAQGTTLSADSPALAALMKKQQFFGIVKLFGHNYMTGYAPITDRNGAVVGAVFVGLDFTESMEGIRDELANIKFGETGYMFVLDADRNAGLLLAHPRRVGQNVAKELDADGKPYIKHILEQKNGEIEYNYVTSGERSLKTAIFMEYPMWHWIVVGTMDNNELVQEAREVRNVLIVGSIALAIILSIIISFTLDRLLSRPLKGVCDILGEISEGNLSVVVPVTANADEVGKMLSSMDQAITKLRSSLTDIRRGSEELFANSHQMLEMSSQVSTNSQKQSDDAMNMAAGVEEMNASVQSVTEGSREASKTAQESDEIARRGESVIESAGSSMQSIAETVKHASKAVYELGEESKAISSIVSTIGDIAEQTNLLALNAAIEAARAGDQGRGFAVVADEVRKLAERAQSSTSEISALIKRILEGTNGAVKQMNEGVKQVESGVEYAKNAGERMADIRAGATRVANSIEFVTTALNEQSAAISSISIGVESVSSNADRNSQAAVESAKLAKTLEGLAEKLKENVGKFRL